MPTAQVRAVLFVHPAGSRCLDQAAVIDDCVVEAVAAGEVAGVKAVSAEDPDCDIAAQSALAHDINCFVFVELVDMFAQVVDGDIDKAVCVAPGILAGSPHIEKDDASIARKGLHILCMKLFQMSQRAMEASSLSLIHI